MPTPLLRSRAAALLLACAGASAHEVIEEAIPASAGWRFGAAAAVTALAAPDPVPVPYLYGVLDTGQAAEDRQGLTLEHATLGGALRVNDWLGARLVVGWHGSDTAHLEAAWVETRWRHDDSLFTLGAGRNKVGMGAPLTNGGDYDRFTLVPLVKRGSLNVDWLDEGVVAAWQPGGESPVGIVELGVWRGTGFPGGGTLPPVPSLHVQALLGDFGLDGFAAVLSPDGRGTYAANTTNPGHTHNVADCNNSLAGLVCFDGNVQVYGASVAWAPHGDEAPPLAVTAAALWRNEQGSLYSQSGDARYRGRTFGGWVDIVWTLSERWELAARGEALRATQDLSGPGASLVAAEARLVPNQPAYRLATALAWRYDAAWRFNVEVGADRNGDATTPYIAARVVWLAPWLLSGSW